MANKSEPTKLMRVVIKEELVKLFEGDVYKAVIFNQMLYWSERVKDASQFLKEESERERKKEFEHGWIYKSAKQLTEEIFDICSAKTVAKKLTELVKAGYLENRHNPKVKYDRTLQYRVNLRFLHDKLKDIGYPLNGYTFPSNELPFLSDRNGSLPDRNSNGKSSETIPETTTEITTEKRGELKNSPAAPVEISFDDLQLASSQNGPNGHSNNGRSGKSLTEMDRGEAENFLMFEAGRTPGAESDPAIERAEREFKQSGWVVRCHGVSAEAVQDAAIYFAAATDYDIPNDPSIRNYWIKALKTHVNEVPLHELYRLYKDTFTQMKSGKNPLTVSDPNSLTKTLLDNWQQKKSRNANDDPMSFYRKIRGNYPNERFAIMAVQDRFQLENWEPVNVSG